MWAHLLVQQLLVILTQDRGLRSGNSGRALERGLFHKGPLLRADHIVVAGLTHHVAAYKNMLCKYATNAIAAAKHKMYVQFESGQLVSDTKR